MNTHLVETGDNGHTLVPANMAEAMRLAEMMASAKLVPRDLQGSPSDCLMVVMQAVRWSMDPFAVAQECSVIQGRLAYSGKLTAAVVNTRGRLAGRLTFEYGGSGPHRAVTVSGQLRGEDSVRSVTVKFADVKTGAKVWQSQPDQQLAYSGARVWARRHMPEVMLGVYGPDEFDEAPSPPTLRRPPVPAPNPMLTNQQAIPRLSPVHEVPAGDGDANHHQVDPDLITLHRRPASFDPETGEVIEDDDTSAVSETAPSGSDDTAMFEDALRAAARSGVVGLKLQWEAMPHMYQQRLRTLKDQLKTLAEEADLRGR